MEIRRCLVRRGREALLCDDDAVRVADLRRVARVLAERTASGDSRWGKLGPIQQWTPKNRKI